MSQLRNATEAFVRACDQLQRTAKALGEELKKVIDPLVPGLTYTYGADEDGEPAIIILDLEQKHPWPEQDDDGEVLEQVIEQAMPEILTIVASDTWLDKDTADKVRKALEEATR